MSTLVASVLTKQTSIGISNLKYNTGVINLSLLTFLAFKTSMTPKRKFINILQYIDVTNGSSTSKQIIKNGRKGSWKTLTLLGFADVHKQWLKQLSPEEFITPVPPLRGAPYGINVVLLFSCTLKYNVFKVVLQSFFEVITLT